MPRKIKHQQSRIVPCKAEDAAPQIAALGREIVTLREQNCEPFMGLDGEMHCGQCGAPVNGGGVYQELPEENTYDR